MNITIVCLGYVGLSNAVLLAQHNNVRAGKLQLTATVDKDYAYGHQPEFVVVAAPTDYDENDQFNTEALEN